MPDLFTTGYTGYIIHMEFYDLICLIVRGLSIFLPLCHTDQIAHHTDQVQQCEGYYIPSYLVVTAFYSVLLVIATTLFKTHRGSSQAPAMDEMKQQMECILKSLDIIEGANAQCYQELTSKLDHLERDVATGQEETAHNKTDKTGAYAATV